MSDPTGASRILRTFRSREVRSVGLRRRFLTDLYHALLTSSWLSLFLLIILGYVAANALFAVAYLAVSRGLDNLRPSDFLDALFSVQTLAGLSTPGYGQATTALQLLATVKGLTGMLGTAVATGLIFTKFARPGARVMFSQRAVISPLDRVPSLMFRIANERASQIVEAQLRVMLALDEESEEGHSVRTVHDLVLKRSSTPLFALSWTAVHAIDRDSPLHGHTAQSLLDCGAEIIVALTGFDESLHQTVHARHIYSAQNLAFGSRFAEIARRGADGALVIDYRNFHQVEPLTGAAAGAARQSAEG
jgi:inward rectifier potassium channel